MSSRPGSRPLSRLPSVEASTNIVKDANKNMCIGLERRPSAAGSSGSASMPAAAFSRVGSAFCRRPSQYSHTDEGDDDQAGGDGGDGVDGAGVAQRAGGGGRVARQLLYSELLSRPGGPWAWMEAGNIREKALPKVFNLKVFDFLDIKGISKMERSARLWRDLLQTRDGQVAWQRVVHEAVGKERIECYKVALGLRAGQSYEQETNDLQSRNWRRIMRMHRSNLRLPLYQTKAKVTLLKDHIGAVLAMCTGGPYLFTGGSDGKLLMFRVPVFLTFTKEREKTLMAPPQPVRGFGQSRTKNGPNFAHDGPVLCLIAEKDFVLSAGVDGTIKLWKMESAPGNACARKYIGHQGAIWCLALGTHTQDGSDIQVMISGSADRTVAIWNIWGPKNARPLMVLKGHFGGVTCLCFVPGMGQVVSGSEDCSIRLWRLTKKEAAHKQGLCEMVLEGHTEAVTALSVFCGKAYPCGTSYDFIYSASRAGDIRMWNREGAVQLKQVQAHAGPVTSLSSSLIPECCFASTGVDGAVRLWRPHDLACLRELHPPKPSDIAAEAAAVRKLVEDEKAAALQGLSFEAMALMESPTSPASSQQESDEESWAATHATHDASQGLQGEDSAEPDTGVGEELRGLMNPDDEAVDESSSEEESRGLDVEGAGGLTSAILWGSIIFASSWDGLIRVWVYTED